ncbi:MULTISPECIES: winged helix-turn-helix transcriptional regulator [Paenibacillus]|uniref:winged helix-turn-helix transcriptional regulator n=1 Tax=Paenibacillus TaxID=44249 RepID=UPI001F21C70A|nr:helix-turn-helix domain-containing protein [Paenibacillus sp. JJ-223]CAH1201732.1 HTH-type transcriptional regulator YodB [Paenibacillus sp. JJ-223]
MSDDKNANQLCGKVEQSYLIIGRKWVALIIHALMEEPKRFSEIHAYIPDLSKRVLNDRMKELEEEGIVVRHVVTERPVRTEYMLTRKGTELGRALGAVEQWAEKWL